VIKSTSYRVLSFSIQLSDPALYDGGMLEVGGPGNASAAQGTAVLFPSYSLHRVHPVTQGERWSIVSWWWGEDHPRGGATDYVTEAQTSLEHFARVRPGIPAAYLALGDHLHTRIALRNMRRDLGFQGNLASAERAWQQGVEGYGALAAARDAAGEPKHAPGDRARLLELEAKVMTCQALREKMPDASDDEHANMLSRVVPDAARQIVERREKEL